MKNEKSAMRQSFDALKIGTHIYKDRDIIDNHLAITDELLASRKTESQEQLIRLVDILMKRNLLDKAFMTIERILSKEPHNTVFIEKKGLILQEMEKYSEAGSLFRSLIRKEPDNPRYHNLLGECHHLSGRDDLAVKQYKKALKSAGRDLVSVYEEFDARESLSFIYYEAEKYHKAIEQIEKVISKNSRHPLWRLLFKILEKLNDQQALQKAQNDYKRAKTAEKHFLKGEEYFEQGLSDRALECYAKAAAAYPEEPEYHYALGNLYMEEKDYVSAEIHLTRALEIFPENERFLLAVTGCLIGIEHYALAYKYAGMGFQRSPMNFIDSLETLSISIGKVEDYIETLKKTIADDTNEIYPLLRFRLAKVYQKQGLWDLSKIWFQNAVKIFKKKTYDFPGLWKNFAWLGDALTEIDSYDEALDNYRKARKLLDDEDLPVTATRLDKRIADTYSALKQYDKAIKAYKLLIEIDPSNAEYHRKIGINYVKKGEYKKALKSLEEALGKDERDPETLYYLALANCSLNHLGSSVKYLKRVISIEPSYLETAKKEVLLSPIFKNGSIEAIIKYEMLEGQYRNIVQNSQRKQQKFRKEDGN